MIYNHLHVERGSFRY